MSAQIKAIIFDCFGVLTTDGWLPFKQKFFGNDPELLQQATDLNKQVDGGLMDYEDFVRQIAELAGVTRQDTRSAIESNVADEALFSYIASQLKPHYKIGLLSNAGANWLDKLFSSDQTKLFDAVALSYATGFVKPDERAYRAIAMQLGVEPEQCIFTDDQPRYCEAARQYGMQAIVYESFSQFKSAIETALPE